jgi:hypothetical protein
MSSWANRGVSLAKAQESPSHPFFSPSEDFASSALAFLYWSIYHQRSAEPFYIYDPQGALQPVFQGNPSHHFLKEPSSGSQLSSTAKETSALLSSLPLSTLKRLVTTTFVYTPQTRAQIDRYLAGSGFRSQLFEVGVVLDVSGSVPKVIQSIKTLQTRLGKKTLSVFIATEDLSLLQEFAKKGDPTWTYRTLIRPGAPRSRESDQMKRLAELQILQSVGSLVLSLRSATGKLLYLTNQTLATPSHLVSWDGSSWKPFE